MEHILIINTTPRIRFGWAVTIVTVLWYFSILVSKVGIHSSKLISLL